MLPRFIGSVSLAFLWLLGGCSGAPADPAGSPGGPSATGGTPAAAGTSNPGAAGTAPANGGSGNTGGVAQATGGTSSNPTGGQATTGGSDVTGGAPAGGAGGAVAAGGSDPGNPDPQAPRPINVQPGQNTNLNFNGQSLFVNKSKPAQGKLVLLLGGICTGTGAGGFESFVKQYGFHVFAPKTDTCLTGGSVPDQYKQTVKAMPDDVEANRQVSDARMELWDGMDRVSWYAHSAAESIQQETIDALKYAQGQDPGGDWAWFLNADGSLRTTDVYVVGYSWGSQSWAMISSFVRFGRVICTSGPVSEGFPNGGWITHPGPNATPGDRKYILVDLKMPYPSAGEGNMEKFDNVIRGGWDDDVTSVTPNGTGTYTATQHLFAMIGSNAASPGGHTVFCNDNPQNGWLPVCKHVLGVE
jgi:hypothetical protein